MIKTKKVVTPESNKEFTNADKNWLIEEIYETSVGLEYLNAHVFKNIVTHVVGAFLRGRQIGTAHPLSKDMIPRLIRFSRRTRRPTLATVFFSDHAKKVSKADIEASPSKEAFLQTVAKHVFPKMAIQIEFGYVTASEMGEAVQLSSLDGFLAVFESTNEMRKLGIDLHSAACEIEKARTIAKPDAISEDYHLEIFDEFEQLRTANAWLYPANDTTESHPIPADELFSAARNILRRNEEPLTDLQIAANLGVTKTQARKWLERLVQEDGWEKLERPVRYKLR